MVFKNPFPSKIWGVLPYIEFNVKMNILKVRSFENDSKDNEREIGLTQG